MNESEFFPARPETRPMIYAYEEDNPKYAGMLKVGFASSGVEKRVAEQFPILKPGDKKPYKIVFDEYHFGAWKDSAKKLFEVEEDDEVERRGGDWEGGGSR